MDQYKNNYLINLYFVPPSIIYFIIDNSLLTITYKDKFHM